MPAPPASGARAAALARYGLHRFLADWDALLAQVVAEHRRPSPSASSRRDPAAVSPTTQRRAA